MIAGKGIVVAATGWALIYGLSFACAAERPKAVVELFTSQGCSSCPPADALLTGLAAEGDVVALSYHIDYWDYQGWKDTLAKPENTERQRAYARAFGGRSVYTPQVVVNGRDHMNGASESKVRKAISAMEEGEDALAVDVSVARDGDAVIIEAGPGAAGVKSKAHVLLVFYTPETSIVVERGENAGRTLAYTNTVTGVQAAGMWHGKQGRWEIPASELDSKGGSAAVLIQKMGYDGKPGPILGAATLSSAASQ